MTTTTPKVVATSYYDGATEGFVDGMQDDQVYFFKVVAWDENQDKRLYAMGQVERDVYSELLELLVKSQRVQLSSTWTPSWVFESEQSERRANEIVDAGKRSAIKAAIFAMGDDLTTANKVVPQMPENLFDVFFLSAGQMPGNLEEWMPGER